MTSSVDWFASQPHYADHLRPIRYALPEQRRGDVYGMPRSRWGDDRSMAHRSTTPIVVASAVDAARFSHRPVIYVEHGAGQSYDGDPRSIGNPSYSGGAHLDHVVLFICPNQNVADRWAQRYPAAKTAVVGCPRLDQHHGAMPHEHDRPRVAFTFHWDCKLIPETRSAWKHYRDALLALIASHPAYDIACHAHPRAEPARDTMRSMGARMIGDVDDLLGWCDVLVADNTSVLYEACALGKSTLVLNAPWYRRGIDHGMRFWDYVPGPQIDEPTQLATGVDMVLSDPGWGAGDRAAAADAAYGGLVGDGLASVAAEIAILGVL